MPLVAMQAIPKDWQIVAMPIEGKPDQALMTNFQNGDKAMFRSMLYDCCEKNPVACDPVMDSLNSYGLSGLGAAAPAPAPAPQKIELTAPAPLTQATIYGVVLVSVLAIMGSVAVWAWSKGNKK